METNGMFDQYMKGDKQFTKGTRELEPDESMADPEPKQRPEDAPDDMHGKHMEMMCQMMHMMQEMFGMFSTMLKSAPSGRKTNSYHDEDE